MMIRRSGVFAALLAVLLVAGCAGTSTGSPSAESSSSAAPSFSPAPSLSAEPTGKPAPGTQTISGTITAGVEAHCLLLQDAGGSHQLVFRDPALRAQATVGAKVTLVGTPQPKMLSTCQQGIPFIVSAVRAS